MQGLELLVDFHVGAERQGPGGEAETLKALDLANVSRESPLKIVDLGCGTGASTLTLAKHLNAQITAVDLFPEFLDQLMKRRDSQGLVDQISTLKCSMETLPFEKDQFDIIWSEGAIYNIGFKRGIELLWGFLKPGGKLVLSEITWLTNKRPSEIEKHWHEEYPEVGMASEKMGILEANGYSPEGYFVLPERCWLDNYYDPIESRFEDFLSRHGNSESATEIVESERKEIALYKKYRQYFSYGFYIARKCQK